MPRGRAWKQDEIRGLLSVVQDSGEAVMLMSSTSRPNEALWQEISRRMAAAGYDRSVAQCRSKWKALKQAFHSQRETCLKRGQRSPLMDTYHRAMKSIWKAAGEPALGECEMRGLVKMPSRKHRSAPATSSSSSPKPPEHSDSEGTSTLLLSPLVQHATDGTESCGLADQKQEEIERKPGPSTAGLLQNIQQLLEQILQTSRQQQVLLEGLANDTVSRLTVLSHSLMQVGKTLHELLIRPQTHPGILGHYGFHRPLSEGGHISSDVKKEDTPLYPSGSYTPP